MAENIRQRKRFEESNDQSSKDDRNREITLDQDDRRTQRRAAIPLS